MERRTFLKSITLPAAGAVVGVPSLAGRARASTAPMGWRTFEVTTKVEVIQPRGVARAWLPVPLMTDTDYFKRLGDNWTGNTSVTRLYRDEKYDAGMLYAEWRSGESAPVVELTSRFATRDRNFDLSKLDPSAVKESPAALKKYLEGTKLIPIDGIVLETSQEITKGATADVEKARAIYEWIVDNTFRDPKVRGCGLGDIKTMLETRARPTRRSSRVSARAVTSARLNTAATRRATAGCRSIPPTSARSCWRSRPGISRSPIRSRGEPAPSCSASGR